MLSQLHVYQSPDLKLLARQFLDCYQQTVQEIFEETQVIVPNFAMRDWLEQRLAREQGISARVRFPLWLEFQRGLVESVYQQQAINAGSAVMPLSDAALRWMLFAYLLQYAPVILNDTQHVLFVSLRSLFNEQPLSPTGLSEGQIQRLWAYAEETARIFTGYLAMRPEWLQMWANDKPVKLSDFVDKKTLAEMPDWLQTHYRQVLSSQCFIWRELFAKTAEKHEVMNRFFYTQAVDGKLTDLPPALFVFTLPTLNEQILEFLNVLAQTIPVYVFHHTVSNQYFPDIVDSRWLRRLSVSEKENQHRSSGHELVSRFGKNHRERLRLLAHAGLAEELVLLEREKPVNSLLSRLQDDIARMDDAVSLIMDEEDDSLRIHGCHGLLRQLEVLRGELVRWLNADTTRKPADILIVLPDIEAQQSIVRAVFPETGAYDGYHLPVRLTGTTTPSTQNLWQAVGGIYALADGDFDWQSVADWLLLEDNCLAYGVSHEEMFSLLEKLQTAGFRRGFDEAHLQRMLGTNDGDDRYCFCYALDRLVSGYAMIEVDWYADKVVPMSAISSQSAPALEALCQFAEDIALVQAERGKLFDALEGLERLRQRLYTRYAHSINTQSYQIINERIEDVFYQLVGNEYFGYGKNLPVLPMRFIVRTVGDSLNTQRVSSEPSGVITIGSLSALRTLPYKLIVFAGAEEGRFPASIRDKRYNLIEIATAKLGDKSREQDDLSAFLEMLCAAEECCWIFYTAVNPNDGEPCLPPAPVQELLTYLQENLPVSSCNYHILHESDPFHPDAGSTHPAPLWQKVRKNMLQQQIRQAWTMVDFPENWREQPLLSTKNRQVTPFAHTINSLKSPVVAFLQAQEIRLDRQSEQIIFFEPLETNGLSAWQIDDKICQLTEHPQKTEILSALPLLPVGKMGKLTAKTHEYELNSRREMLFLHAKVTAETPLINQQVSLADMLISAYLPVKNSEKWVRLSHSKARPKYLLEAYLYHLLWQFFGECGESIISFKDEIKTFAPVSKEEAELRLIDWLKLSQLTQQYLYPLSPELVSNLLRNKEKNIFELVSNYLNPYPIYGTPLADELAWRFVLQGQHEESLAHVAERLFHDCQDLYLPVF